MAPPFHRGEAHHKALVDFGHFGFHARSGASSISNILSRAFGAKQLT
jgi:hypothetical protein